MANVKLFGNLRKHTDKSLLQIPGGSVRAVLEALCKSYPSLREALFENGYIRQHFKIILNGHDILLAKSLDTEVSDHDQISIFPAIAGG